MSTKFFLWLLIFAVKFNVALLGEGTSYGSSASSPVNPDFQYTEKEADCLAWRFTLAATLITMVRRTHASILRKKSREDEKIYGYIKAIPSFYVDEVFPAEKIKKTISTIIKKEGGFCSRELLYDTPCIKNIPYGPVHGGGPSYTSALSGEIKINYFAQIMGVPLDEYRISELDGFLRDHMSKSPDTKSSFYGLYCESKSAPCVGANYRDGSFRYFIESNFGFCILKKHKIFLKENNIFDVEANNYMKNFHKLSFDQDSLEFFIKRSNEIAEEAADSH